MARRPTRSVPTVIVPGWQGSGPGHWQVWLGEQLDAGGREVIWPALPDVDHPDLDGWLGALRAALVPLPETGYDVVAHSLGAVLWLHHIATADAAPRPDRVALVAPPAPQTLAAIGELAGFTAVPLVIDTVRRSAEGTVLVGGDADPYLPDGIAATYGRPLKMATTVIEGAAHINVEDGHGEWPAVLDWCNRDNLAFF
jgi:predicted alpha/beta hydrolase family esterase